ncbi:bifunctional P-450/NADPH--P450 reductase [Bacillus spizizenii ATCC 6633 = JCM 2499]|uniref:Bifunctional cytochrome P450/NADPH--P450 reductase n=1 Tax=Bacillus spizizenii (strain ATCC 23059 / NRRL B-14472 / W23) TaxID=655816 RepID=E0TUX6_BACSH|nr:bifunctional P-450/NADPH--P450 reductase [Bacillus spizizenii]QCJ16080.1 cytochrome P450 [Bacillus subtilis]ADM36794.1 putative bifunctional P-450/NADPH-P450 reductase 1 [Bacillus spizizenii str. W23]AJW86213.1 NADPH--cytochrome P450 reductase [Bacillus spizizenii]EFG91781.1 putative cytochrome P450 CYP102A2 [Bacillus spizizenii ATCC 6633 = JCM 2499]KFK80576.1 FAD binding domain protein [Bacillus spizizenii]
MKETSPIPQPKTYGPLGNLPLIDKDKPTLSLIKLAEEQGPIFQIHTPAGTTIVVSGHELVKEVCDEERFDKSIEGALEKVRAFSGDGLFTSWTHEPNWRKAHNILMPTFSQRAMKDYHEKMVDIAVQLIQKWARLNPNEAVDVPGDMTRLTLDTIGLCGFNYRFNSYYRETPHPFINSMVRALDEAMHQMQRLDFQDKLMVRTKRQFHHDIQTMFSLVDSIIAERRSNGDQDEKDLLARMLNVEDPETGEKLDDENIRFQIITFLIAGHETTSGLLSFAIYFLLKHPDKLKKAYEEVDRVLTGAAPTYKQVLELKYIRMILNESLRLWPTAPAFSLYPKEDTVIGGKYMITTQDRISVLIPQLHRDQDAWGEDAEEFRPERFEHQDQVPHHAYKPFGNGQRACIGMQFALHEATLVLGMVLKYFTLIDHENYELDIKQTLTLKPGDFRIRVQTRHQEAIHTDVPAAEKEAPVEQKEETETKGASVIGLNNRPLLVLYGSDTGTAEGVARELADTASLHGVRTEVAPLNDRIGKLPKEGAVVIVTASYNGKPPSNAGQFVQWLQEIKPGELEGVHYAVFGCGDHNWASTYQYVPRFIDEQLAEKGATRFSERGEGDVSGDFEGQLDEWKKSMWTDAIKAFGLELNENADKERSTLSLQFVRGLGESPLARSYEAAHASIAENRELQSADSDRSTRHIEIALPPDVEYREGDHLGVLPRNSQTNVSRILHRFGLKGTDQVTLSASGRSAGHLPLGRPVSLHDLLSYSVEVQEAATRAQIRELAAFTVCPPHKRELEDMTEEGVYQEQILKKRISMLDLLEQYESCEMPFERFLELLRPLKPRYYSISSSPRVNPEQASITVGVVRGPAWSGRGEYRGVSSSYLAERQAGDDVVMFVRTPESRFQLPEDPETPIIMVGPGTGVAPFRGFLQARAALKREGKALGEAHLYFGCRNDHDFIYRDELEQFEKDGIVTVHTAFSRKEGMPKTYVQHLMADHAETLISILDRGGRLYVCGDGSKMAPDVEAGLQKAYQSVHGTGEEEAQNWLKHLQDTGIYAKDVWSGV